MEKGKTIKGFSKLSKIGKIMWIADNFFRDPERVVHELKSYWLANENQQKVLDGFSENTISNFPMPYGVAPNFIIDGDTYCVPMVIEESSVVAAASAAAKFWMNRGGFKTEVLNTKKIGQVHFVWSGDTAQLNDLFPKLKAKLLADSSSINANMVKRGGGVVDIQLVDLTHEMDNYYQLKATFETCDSMGANYINSNLESFATSLENFLVEEPNLSDQDRDVQIVMSILSNYTPECIVRAEVSCPIEDLGTFPGGMLADEFAEKFERALKIAHIDPHRATTHNKGIYNGIDAVVIATGNDFRAIEACGHTYAARDGHYRSLSHCSLDDGIFRFWIEVPLAIGTVGGLTALHPIAKRSLELLNNPSAETLMRIIATVGLAQNFGAVRSLVTTGIQQGHMKMHLQNILNQLGASPEQISEAQGYFENRVVSFSAVRDFMKSSK